MEHEDFRKMEMKVGKKPPPPPKEFVHIKNDGKECGSITKVIDDKGDIYYICNNCGKKWITGEKATP